MIRWLMHHWYVVALIWVFALIIFLFVWRAFCNKILPLEPHPPQTNSCQDEVQ